MKNIYIKTGVNMGKKYPCLKSIENFEYDGFGVSGKEGFAPYLIESFIEWTNDPGIAKFKCSDGKERYIPVCQLNFNYYETLPKQKLVGHNGVGGKGLLFGSPCKS